jgi:hypothetical protein
MGEYVAVVASLRAGPPGASVSRPFAPCADDSCVWLFSSGIWMPPKLFHLYLQVA